MDRHRSLKIAYPVLAEIYPPCFHRDYSAKFAGVSASEYFHIMVSLELLKFLLREGAVSISWGPGFEEHGEGFVRIALCENIHRIRPSIRLIKSLIGGPKYSEPLDKGNMNSRAAYI